MFGKLGKFLSQTHLMRQKYKINDFNPQQIMEGDPEILNVVDVLHYLTTIFCMWKFQFLS